MADDQKRIFKQKRLNTRLLEAVYTKDLEKVKTQLANEAHPDTQCQVSLVSPSHLAAYHGSVPILEELLKKDADLTKTDIRGLQPHHLAAFRNESLPCLKIILDKMNDLIDSPVRREQTETTLRDEVSDSYGHNHNDLTNLIREEIKDGATALYIATKKGLTKVVEELLERNATVTEEILDLARNQNDISIMLKSAYKKHPKMGELQMAVFKGNVEVVQKCLHKMGNDELEPTMLHLAVHNKLKNESNKHDYNEILVMLVETERININYQDENNKTPLYLATESKWMDDIDWLLTKNADETIECRNGETVFHVAARNKDCNVLKYLLKTKPKSNALKQTDNEGYTPLYRAIKSGCADCVQVLLATASEDDYKLILKDRELTILHAAIESSRNPDVILQKILEFLMKNNSPENISIFNQISSEGLTAVELAAKNGEVKCLDVLFKYDISVLPMNIDKKKHHDTALHHAAKKGYYVCLEKLLDRCEDLVDMLDSNCLTALIYAARGGHNKCVKLLLKRGANLAIKDPSLNRTAVDIIMSNVPTAVESIDDVLDSFIVPIKNTQLVEVTTKIITENNQNNETIPDQEEIPLLNSINNDENNTIHEQNPSANQVAIDINTDGPTAEDKNVQNNSSVPNNQQTEVTTILSKNIIQNNKQINNQVKNPVIKNSNYNEHYKIHKVNLEYKCLLAGSRQLEVIEAVNECKYDKLKQKFFLHPLVKTFLISKWNKIKNLHLILFFVYLIHTLSVTGLAICATIWLNLIAYLICFIFILLTMIPIILVEIVTWVQDAKIYSRFETYIKWIGILLIGLFSVMSIFPQISFIISYFASVAVLFSWMKLILFFSMRCNGGFYILLFFKIAQKVFQVLCLFSFLIFGFALSFYILFNGRKPFPDPLTSLGAVMAMISEIKYDEAFGKETDLILKILGHILFIMFYVLVVIVMMNLIVGLSVNIVTEHEGKCKHLAMQGSFLSLVDKFCWDGETNKFIIWLRELIEKISHYWTNKKLKEKEKINSITIFPNQLLTDNIFGKELIFEVMEIVNNKAKRYRPETMAHKMDKMRDRVDEVLDLFHRRN
ncbi:unnamed protein product [Nezara viridula]|uniref:Uncharacterized protein n=1 Tax=Nezara viridula TaxID=85310 RepID=A0A9P0MPP6_NEZVI|nr:unnamed protein product [Nezara viridula]